MNVAVCLHAPAHADDTGLVEGDAQALAHAVALAGQGREVTAVMPGTSREAAPLRRALAAGVDRALRVAADDLNGADLHTVGQVLSIVLRRAGADLIVVGMRTDGDGLGSAGAVIARHLGARFVPGVEEILAGGGSTVEVAARGGGLRRRLRVRLPAVLAVSTAPATPPAARVPAAGAPEIEVLSLSDPEATVVRRRTELLGRHEAASRGVATVSSAAELIAALARR